MMQFVQCRAASGTTASLLFAVSLGWGLVPVQAGAQEVIDQVLEAERAGAQVILPLASLKISSYLDSYKSRREWYRKYYRPRYDKLGIAPPRPQDPYEPPGPVPTCLFKGGLCGALNIDGSVAVPPQFDFVDRFHEGRARVRFQGRFGFVDTKGHVAVPLEWDEVESFKDGIARVRSKKLFGFVDTSGRLIIPARYEEAGKFENGTVQMRLGNKISLYDNTGRLLVAPKYRQVVRMRDGLYWVDAGNTEWARIRGGGYPTNWSDGFSKWGLVDSDGNWVFEPEFRSVRIFDKADGDLMWVESRPRGWGLVRSDGTWVWKPQFKSVESLSHGRARVRRADLFGYLGEDGRFVIEQKFDKGRSFRSDSSAQVSISGKIGIVHRTGSWIMKPVLEADGITGEYNIGAGWVVFFKNNKKGVADLGGRVIIPAQFERYGFQVCDDGRVFGRINKKEWRYYLPGGKILKMPEDRKIFYDCGSGPFKVKVGENFGYVDGNLKTIIRADYDRAWSFNRDGLALVGKDGRTGVIRDDGTIVVEPERYDSIGGFRKGIAIVRRDGKFGAIRDDGTELVPPDLEHASDFGFGYSDAKAGGKWGLLGVDGSWIVKPRDMQKVSRLFKGLVPAERDGKWGFIDATGEFVIPARYFSVRPFHQGVAYVEIDNRDCPIDRRGRRIESLECKVHQYRPKRKRSAPPVYPPFW